MLPEVPPSQLLSAILFSSTLCLLKSSILGANGFIGSSSPMPFSSRKTGKFTAWTWVPHKLANSSSATRASSSSRATSPSHREWIEYHVKKCDAVLPLVAIANPAQYVKDPLRVSELDFGTPRGHPPVRALQEAHHLPASTSEAYGMCPDWELFDEAASTIFTGRSRSSAGFTRARSSSSTA